MKSQQKVRPLRIALGEYDIGWHDAAGSLERAEVLVRAAARAGARLVVLPEMCVTGFTMESQRRAEPADGPNIRKLAAIAKANRVWLLAGVATEAARVKATQRAHNSALLFNPSGVLRATYHKQRLFAYGREHRHYAPGRAPLIVKIEGVRLSPFICYDLRFPELFRQVAAKVDGFVVLANWPVSRRPHWDLLVRARAIENLCYMVAVNRTGRGGTQQYNGGSAAYGPWGEPLPTIARKTRGTPVIVEIDPARTAEVRREYPFLDDR